MIYLLSKVNETVTLPSLFSGVNITSLVTGFPLISKGLPVDLSIRVPTILYSLPTVRFLYSTISSIVISPLAVTSFLPFTFAVVLISGTFTVTV